MRGNMMNAVDCCFYRRRSIMLLGAMGFLVLRITVQAWTPPLINRPSFQRGPRDRNTRRRKTGGGSATSLRVVADLANVTDVAADEIAVRSMASPSLQELQLRGRNIVTGFEISDMFEPVPWLSNCHVQTIGGFLLRNASSSSYARTNADHLFHYVPRDNPGAIWMRIWQSLNGSNKVPSVATSNQERSPDQPPVPFWDQRERIETPDGDWFHADTKYATGVDSSVQSQRPLVILLHGLASSSMSPVSRDMAQAIVQEGMDCVCLNFRGCSGTANNQLGGYHLGFSDDLRLYLERLAQYQDQATNIDVRPIYLAGFSLGANVVLKCLGELRESATQRFNIQGAVALCAPLDQTRNAATLAQPGINRWIYTNNLLQSLQTRSFEQYQSFYGQSDTEVPGIPKLDMVRAMDAQTITEFDDAFIAPVYGFDDCWDYYRQTSSIHHLDSVAVPTLILNARDDPFFDSSVWPVSAKSNDNRFYYRGDAPIQMVRSDHGGHLGYVLHQVDSNDPRLDPKEGRHSVSWSADQMGRFFRYLQALQ